MCPAGPHGLDKESEERGMASRRLRRVLGATALAIPGLMAGMSSAALPVSAQTPGCVSSGSTTICTFVSTGAEQSFKLPAGVTQVGVKLVGAPGGNGGKTGILTPTGGKGGTVNATLGGLTQGTTLFVEVGGKGGDGGLVAVGAAGFNGGASGGTGGSASGGGGGGGGGGGLFGGGGGGGGAARATGTSGGGGGGGCGSPSVPPGGTVTPDTTGVPEVVVSYTLPPAPVATPTPLPQPPSTGGGGPSPFPLPLFGLLGLLLLCGTSVVGWQAFENAREMPARER